MTAPTTRLFAALAACAALAATATARADAGKRRVAVLEFRAGSGAMPDRAKRVADRLRATTSHSPGPPVVSGAGSATRRHFAGSRL